MQNAKFKGLEVKPQVLLLFGIKTILFPFCRIVFYVIPYFQIISLTAYNMVVEGTLENFIPNFVIILVDLFCNIIF